MQKADLLILEYAAQQLESSSLATSMSDVVGVPIEKAMAVLPGHWSTVASRVTRKALDKSLHVALYSLNKKPFTPRNKTHTFVAGVSGAIGGTFGITTLAVELPISVTIMLRSIADIARSQGENLDHVESKMACLTVFALSGGGSQESSDSADTSYYAVRSFLTKAISDTANHMSVHGLSTEAAPIMIKFINAVSVRFSLPVSEKLALQSLPIIGAVGGASLNCLFIRHYQKMAQAHFSIRSLERQYGQQLVEKKYKEIVRVKP